MVTDGSRGLRSRGISCPPVSRKTWRCGFPPDLTLEPGTAERSLKRLSDDTVWSQGRASDQKGPADGE